MVFFLLFGCVFWYGCVCRFFQTVQNESDPDQQKLWNSQHVHKLHHHRHPHEKSTSEHTDTTHRYTHILQHRQSTHNLTKRLWHKTDKLNYMRGMTFSCVCVRCVVWDQTQVSRWQQKTEVVLGGIRTPSFQQSQWRNKSYTHLDR